MVDLDFVLLRVRARGALLVYKCFVVNYLTQSVVLLFGVLYFAHTLAVCRRTFLGGAFLGDDFPGWSFWGGDFLCRFGGDSFARCRLAFDLRDHGSDSCCRCIKDGAETALRKVKLRYFGLLPLGTD